MKFVIILFFGFNFLAFSQTEIGVYCVDNISNEKIQNAEIKVFQNQGVSNYKTNKSGYVKISIDTTLEFKIEIKHSIYIDFITESSATNLKNKSLTLKLQAKIQELESVDAFAPGVPSILFQSEKLSVADFELLPNAEILLLLYPKTLKKGSELAVFNGKEILTRFIVPEKPLELIHDFRNNPHVVCENGVFGIHRAENKLGISTIEKSYFMKYIFPIVDTSFSKYYFSNFNKNYPAFDYKMYDQLDSSYSSIIEIKDDLMMELYRSEYKWVDVRAKLWAKNLELETGIDKEVWIGANYFTQSIYYKELYAPMFKKGDSIFVFDYYKDKLFTFDITGIKIDSVDIFHHYNPKKSGWKKNLIQDKETGEIFAYFEKDGTCSLKSIDLKTGKFDKTIQFQHKYIDKIAVFGNMVYYIYRPFESLQKKFLYQVKIDL